MCITYKYICVCVCTDIRTYIYLKFICIQVEIKTETCVLFEDNAINIEECKLFPVEFPINSCLSVCSCPNHFFFFSFCENSGN